MKRNKIKVLSLTISLMLLLSLQSATAIAKSSNKGNNEVGVISNEYLKLKSLKDKSKIELNSMGYDDILYDLLQNLDQNISNHIKDMQKYSDTELKSKFKYKDSQVDAIRNFDGSESAKIRASAACTIYMNAPEYYYKTPYTYATLEYTFCWSGMPTYIMTDIVAIGWNCGLYYQSSYLNVTYMNTSDNIYHKTYSASVEGSGNYGLHFTFPLGESHNSVPYFAQTGTGKLFLRKQELIPEFGAKVEYSHQYMLGSVGITIGISGSGPSTCISISFSPKTESECQYFANPQL